MEGFMIFLAIVVIVVAIVVAKQKKEKELRQAEKAYKESLKALKSSPTDADLKEETLRLGRVYSHLTRDKEGTTVFDEVALMNDINAACAAASTPNIESSRVVRSVEQRLNDLNELKSKGLIDDKEYQSKKSEILKEL